MIKRNRGYGISRARCRDPLTVCVCMCGGEEGGMLESTTAGSWSFTPK